MFIAFLIGLTNETLNRVGINFALLLLRLSLGGLMLANHGYDKVIHFKTLVGDFADPLAVGRSVSLVMAMTAEVLGSVLIGLGFLTRVGVVMLICNMAVAAFMVHGDDILGQGELALVYLAGFMTLLFSGPGRVSLDAVIVRRLGGRSAKS